MIRLSTALRNSLAVSYGIYPHMQGGVIYVFGGTAPLSPDLAANPNEALGTITTEGRPFIDTTDPKDGGLKLLFTSPGILVNDGRWVLTGMGEGEARWFRWCHKTYDSHGDSLLFPRVDGSVGDVLKLAQPIIADGKTYTIDSFTLQIPMGS